VIAQANARSTSNGKLVRRAGVGAAIKGEFMLSGPDKVEYMDVAPARSCRSPLR
jgi:hypothetical protein